MAYYSPLCSTIVVNINGGRTEPHGNEQHAGKQKLAAPQEAIITSPQLTSITREWRGGGATQAPSSGRRSPQAPPAPPRRHRRRYFGVVLRSGRVSDNMAVILKKNDLAPAKS